MLAHFVQVEAAIVDEPQVVLFKASFKLAAEPRGVARSAALAAAEMVLVRLNAICRPTSLGLALLAGPTWALFPSAAVSPVLH